MDWNEHFEEGELLRWEGRPAPRCFSFRNWKHSIFGMLLLLLSVFWLLVGVQLAPVYDYWFLPWIPVPFLLAGLHLSIGHVLFARWEWEKVFYAVTDRRILSRRGLLRPRIEVLRLEEIAYFQMKPLGAELGSFRISGGTPPRTLLLSCIEHPRRLTALLESALAASNRLAREKEPEADPSPDSV